MEPSGYALVVSTENIAQNWYPGNNRSMLIPNTLFRMGAAAIVLTNKRSARWTAKYQLQKVYRVHLGADDNAFRCACRAVRRTPLAADQDFNEQLQSSQTGEMMQPKEGGCSAAS